MLILPIKKQWYDMIVSGEKKEEYREITPYWKTRFGTAMDRKNYLLFQKERPAKIEEFYIRNGYGNNRPTAKLSAVVIKGYGKPDWGAERRKRYFVLLIRSVEEVTIK